MFYSLYPIYHLTNVLSITYTPSIRSASSHHSARAHTPHPATCGKYPPADQSAPSAARPPSRKAACSAPPGASALGRTSSCARTTAPAGRSPARRARCRASSLRWFLRTLGAAIGCPSARGSWAGTAGRSRTCPGRSGGVV